MNAPMPARGLINLNKPAGVSSRRAIDPIKRLARPAKVGHAGTLDPLADGVLVVCVGAATRLTEYVGRMPKQYTGTFLLGRSSPTEDVEGEVSELADPPAPTLNRIVAAKKQFIGRIDQRPPAFSAIKVAGRRAYELARRGQDVQLPTRPVSIYGIEVKRYEYPELVLEIECGGGTYIRSLGRDLAESLGTAAVMSALTRTAIGGFRIEQSVDPSVLNDRNWTDWLLPPLSAVENLARVRLSPGEAARVRNGQSLENRGGEHYKLPAVTPGIPGGNSTEENCVAEIAALDPEGRLVAILSDDGEGRLRPKRVF
ncbi:MAG: tRNA pseudouridine(55) synthase TruB [Pirellulales bacterium]|nr:tRNA pseudouridine(55) synthase TruB [Pirellulales bacterium]